MLGAVVGPTVHQRPVPPGLRAARLGYRNYGHGLALSPNEDTRNWIDDRFHAEMNRICDTRFWPSECYGEAEAFYGAFATAAGTPSTTVGRRMPCCSRSRGER